MLPGSQPLDPKISKRFESESKDELESMSAQNIKLQRIGTLLDDMNDGGRRKISLKTRLGWKWRSIKGSFSDFKYIIRNHFKWHQTMCELRPWEGFDGVLAVMLTHLRDYLANEEQYGHSAEECKKQKIASVRETIALLERMRMPDEYASRRRNDVESRYPKYRSLITEYKRGGTCHSGDFVALRDGWVGMESGADPREGYFEFVDGRLELANSPDQREMDRLLEELRSYHEELHNAYKQAKVDSDGDFEKLSLLLKENLYSWWD